MPGKVLPMPDVTNSSKGQLARLHLEAWRGAAEPIPLDALCGRLPVLGIARGKSWPAVSSELSAVP